MRTWLFLAPLLLSGCGDTDKPSPYAGLSVSDPDEADADAGGSAADGTDADGTDADGTDADGTDTDGTDTAEVDTASPADGDPPGPDGTSPDDPSSDTGDTGTEDSGEVASDGTGSDADSDDDDASAIDGGVEIDEPDPTDEEDTGTETMMVAGGEKAMCRAPDSEGGDSPEYVKNRGMLCVITAEVNWKIKNELIEGGDTATALRDCIAEALDDVDDGAGSKCLDSAGFTDTNVCWDALAEAEKECGGPEVEITEHGAVDADTIGEAPVSTVDG